MSDDTRDDGHGEGPIPSEEDHGYVCHCRRCGGVVAMATATAPDLPETVSGWLALDNTYVERRPLPVIKKLEFCEAALSQ